MGPSADKAAILAAAADARKMSCKTGLDNSCKSEVLSENNNITVVTANTKITLGIDVILDLSLYGPLRA